MLDLLTLYHTMPAFDGNWPFENIVEKGENAGNHHFLLFPKCFVHYQKTKKEHFSNIKIVCKYFQIVKGYFFVVW